MIYPLRQAGLLKGLNKVSLLWAGSLSAGLFAFFAQALMARSFTVQEYGAFATAYRMVSLLAPLAGFGLGACWLRVFGKEGDRAKRWIKPSLILAGCTTLGSGAAAFGLGFVLDSSSQVAHLTFLLAPLLLFWGLSELGRARFQLEGRYEALAFWETAYSLGCFLVAWVIWQSGGDVNILALGFSLVGVVLALFHGRRAFQMPSAAIAMAVPVKDSGDPNAASPRVFDVAAEAMPFALAGVFYLVYHQIGVVLLGWMQGDEPAGIYNVALTVIAALALLPDAVFQKYLMPKTQHWAEHDRAQFLRVYRFGNGVMLASGLGLMLAVGLASPTLVPWVFGDAYQESGRVLLVLALAVPFRFLSVSVGSALVSGGHMARKNVYHGIGATTNVLLNVMLIPGYGVYGVAWSAVITEALLLGLFLRGVRSHVLGPEALQGWNIRLGNLYGP